MKLTLKNGRLKNKTEMLRTNYQLKTTTYKNQKKKKRYDT